MDEEIIVGAHILEYSERLEALSVQMFNLSLDLEDVYNIITDTSVYEGKNQEELQVFYGGFKDRISKISGLYVKCGQYIAQLFEQMVKTDEMLAQVYTEYLNNKFPDANYTVGQVTELLEQNSEGGA